MNAAVTWDCKGNFVWDAEGRCDRIATALQAVRYAGLILGLL